MLPLCPLIEHLTLGFDLEGLALSHLELARFNPHPGIAHD